MDIARKIARLIARLIVNTVTDPYVGFAAVIALVVSLKLDWYPWAGWMK